MKHRIHGSARWLLVIVVLAAGHLAAIPTLSQGTWQPVAADFDGDGRADPAVLGVDGVLNVWLSSRNYAPVFALAPLGLSGWMPLGGDFDGDARADPAIYHSDYGWYAWLSASGYQRTGPASSLAPGYAPVAADFDGDRRADVAIFGANGWYAKLSSQGYAASGPYLPFAEGAGALPMAADFDGDRKADPALFKDGWTLWLSGQGYVRVGPYWSVSAGSASTPLAADFDGDSKADPALVLSTGDWYAGLSAYGYRVVGPYRFLPATVQDVDSDGDGVADWKERMLELDPSDPVSNGLGMTDGDWVAYRLGATNTVNVIATDSYASRAGSKAGAFTVFRSGNLNALTVRYTVGGTAAAGDDYTALSGTVTIAPLADSATIAVTPLQNAMATPRTVTVALGADPDYTLGRATTGTVYISSSPTNIASLGVNTEVLRYYSRSQVFADAMKQSRPWGSIANPSDESAATDTNGWPTTDAGVVILASQPTNIGGTYKLSFKGRATTVSSQVSGVTVANLVYTPSIDYSRADVVVADTATGIMLAFTGTSNGVRNVKLMRPGYLTETFTFPFLQRIAPFQTLKFEDFLAVNGDWNPAYPNGWVNWSDRTLPTHATQYRRVSGRCMGGALEYVAALCNLMHKDAWLSIPHLVSDDCATRIAEFFRDTLDPTLALYVEWSNEVWNGNYAQYAYNVAAASNEVAAGGSTLNYDGTTNPGYWAWRRTARRGKELGDLFRAAYGSAAMMTRVRPVLASQLGYAFIAQQGLEYIETIYGPPSNYFYAVSGAPYFGLTPPSMTTNTSLSVDDIFAIMSTSIVQQVQLCGVYSGMARWYNVKTIAYEGGPDTAGTASYTNKLAANRDERMGAKIVQVLTNWSGVGGGLFCYYHLCGLYDQNGQWGLTDAIDQDTTKTRAIDTVIISPLPALAVGDLAPGTVNATNFVFRRGYDTVGANYVSITVSNHYNYLVRCPAGGTYQVSATVGSGTAGGRLALLANSASLGTFTVPSTGGPYTWSALPAITVTLPAGLNVIRLRDDNGSYNIQSLTIGP